VHEAAPVLFRTRWTLSYLRGPLTLQEIAKLSQSDSPARTMPSPARHHDAVSVDQHKPVVPAEVTEFYLDNPGARRPYLPRVLGVARLHFVDKSAGLDVWETRALIAPLNDEEENADWQQADMREDLRDQLSKEPTPDAQYASTPAAFLRAQNYRAWQKSLASHLYETASFTVFHCPSVGQAVAPGTNEGEFRAKLTLALREKRDAEIEKLRKKYAPRLATLQEQIRRAEERIERERSDLSQHKMQAAISVGTSILGALLGRKAISVGNAQRIGTAARNAGRLGKESGDVSRAEESREVLAQRLADMQNELEAEISRLRGELDPQTVQIERSSVKPRKADITVETVALLWANA
jgi:TolA-binding protein